MYVTLSPAKRQIVEGVVMWMLILSSTIAVLTIIAMFVAVPLGLPTAIYLTEYAPGHIRNVPKPMLAVALPGIAGSLLLATSRAVDETMIALGVVSKYWERYD